MAMKLEEAAEVAATGILGIDRAAFQVPGCTVTDMAELMNASLLAVGEIDLESADQNTHVTEVFESLDRVLYLLRSVAMKMDNQTEVYNQNFSEAMKNIALDLDTIATRLSMSFASQSGITKMNGTMTSYESGTKGPVDVIVDTVAVINTLKDLILRRLGEHDQYCPASCSEEAMLKGKLMAVQANKSLNPDERIMYPGDIDVDDEHQDLVRVELDKMAGDSQYTKLIKLLWNMNTDALLLDPDMRRRFSDAEVSEFKRAFYRTIANLLIGVADAIPAVGEGPSWLADSLKAAKYLGDKMKKRAKWLAKIFPEWFDLTPDVSLSEAVLTEGYEFVTFGFMPSHLIFEFRHQFQHDCPRMVRFLEKVAKVKAELDDEQGATIRIGGGDEKQIIAELKALEDRVANPSAEQSEEK